MEKRDGLFPMFTFLFAKIIEIVIAEIGQVCEIYGESAGFFGTFHSYNTLPSQQNIPNDISMFIYFSCSLQHLMFL